MRVMRSLALTTLFVLFGTIIAPATGHAIIKEELQMVLRNTSYYGDFQSAGETTCGAAEAGATATALTGSDNEQRAFNYFKDKGLNDIQAAAIVANLKAESGVNPKSNQGGGGPGRGIAQWTASERWAVLQGWARGAGKDPLQLGTQLEFLWMELNGTKPAGDYSGAFKQFKQKSAEPPKAGFSQLDVATGFFMGTSAVRQNDSASGRFIAAYGKFGGFENPGIPHLDRRLQAARDVLKSFGTGDSASMLVSGANASCESVGAVNCSSQSATTEGLSQLRQNVVCIARGELQKWNDGKLKPGNDYKLYSYGGTGNWCAWFTSWVYNKAGYKIDPSDKNGSVSTVDATRDFGEAGKRFTFNPRGSYVPVPGDIAVYKGGDTSHVNLVVSVNKNKKQMTVLGGNQGGNGNGFTASKVTEYDRDYNTGEDALVGFVSPKEGVDV